MRGHLSDHLDFRERSPTEILAKRVLSSGRITVTELSVGFTTQIRVSSLEIAIGLEDVGRFTNSAAEIGTVASSIDLRNETTCA